MIKESTPGKRGNRKGYLAIFGLGILLTGAGFLVAYQFVEPAPPPGKLSSEPETSPAPITLLRSGIKKFWRGTELPWRFEARPAREKI